MALRALWGFGLLVAVRCAQPGFESAPPRAPEPDPHTPAPASADAAPAATAPGDLHVAGCVIELRYDDGEPPVDADLIEAWVQNSAATVAAYTGGEFPVPTLWLTIIGGGRRGVGFGMHQDGRRIKIWVGTNATASTFARDWVLIHEMFHAAFPDLSRDHRWMQEGLSTYLEPVARAQRGALTPETVWGKWVRMMDHGRPRLGDRGLDRTHTWGRTYWGGALFWLMADIEIRKRTGNRKSLQDAVVGILDAGGNGRANWSTAKVVAEGDRATNTRALADLYAAMAEAPGDVDLDALWAQLGVVVASDGSVRFDDTAPLADIRRSMTAESPG